MTNNLRKAAEMALEALESVYGKGKRCEAAIEALRQALAQPEQEPVAWMFEGIKFDGTKHGPHLIWKPEYMDVMSANMGAIAVPLYAAPPSIEAAVLAEREACAKLCDLVAKEIDDTNGIATYCAEAIRERGEK